MVTVTFFLCFLSNKASVRHSKVRFSFLKVFFRSTKTHGIWQALLMHNVPWPFVSSFFVVWANLFGKSRHQQQPRQVFLWYQNDTFLFQTTFFLGTKQTIPWYQRFFLSLLTNFTWKLTKFQQTVWFFLSKITRLRQTG